MTINASTTDTYILNVSSYPTIAFYNKGKSDPEFDFDMKRTVTFTDFEEYIEGKGIKIDVGGEKWQNEVLRENYM